MIKIILTTRTRIEIVIKIIWITEDKDCCWRKVIRRQTVVSGQ